jgi:hypothetical protein
MEFEEILGPQFTGSWSTCSPIPEKRFPISDFCMMATSLTWIYACRLEKTPSRRHAVIGRDHFAFSDVRRMVAKAALDDNFAILCPPPGKPVANSVVAALLRLAA